MEPRTRFSMGSGGLKESNKLNAKDYTLDHYISEGAWGKVYLAKHNKTGQKVALKFFGYTHNQPSLKDIQRELKVMLEVNGISGVVQTRGHFMDTTDGIIPDKTFKEKYPVIVMELLEGGHMLSRVNSQKNVSEHYIALSFKRLIVALDSLHRKQFIHRDVKLENIMFLDVTDYSPVKIIDLGMMVHCPVPSKNAKEPNYNFAYQDKRCRGTPGYFAPESISLFQYTPKSDLWQAGCVLYSLLSGMPAFNPNIPEQATDMTYFPMKGNAWDNVSDLGKDLVSKMLKKDPKKRLSSDEILRHPWILGHAPDTALGEDYLSRIKQLVLRQRLKAFFVDNKIEKNSKERRQHLEQVLPFLSHYTGNKGPTNSPLIGSAINPTRPSSDPSLGSSQTSSPDENRRFNTEFVDRGAHSLSSHGPSDPHLSSPPLLISPEPSTNLYLTPEKQFRDKLRTLKIEVIRSVSLVDRDGTRLLLDGDDEEVDKHLTSEQNGGREIREVEKMTPSRSSGIRLKQINYDTFVSILHRCELPELADRQVFNIFDWKDLGTIDMKEFLLTMLAFQPLTEANDDAIEEGNGQENSFSYDSKGENENSQERLSQERHERLSSSDRISQSLLKRQEIGEAARLYFKMFDVYERGYLSLEDLRIGIECILSDPVEELGNLENGKSRQQEQIDDTHFNIETLFDTIDVKKTGKIEFKEFKLFYNNLLIQTMGMAKSKKLRSRLPEPPHDTP